MNMVRCVKSKILYKKSYIYFIVTALGGENSDKYLFKIIQLSSFSTILASDLSSSIAVSDELYLFSILVANLSLKLLITSTTFWCPEIELKSIYSFVVLQIITINVVYINTRFVAY